MGWKSIRKSVSKPFKSVAHSAKSVTQSIIKPIEKIIVDGAVKPLVSISDKILSVPLSHCIDQCLSTNTIENNPNAKKGELGRKIGDCVDNCMDNVRTGNNNSSV